VNIAQFAQRCGLTAHTLRYYERIGMLGDVARQDNGHRTYGSADLTWVEFLQRLRATGMPIREMVAYAKLRTTGDATLAERQTLLRKHADRLDADLREQQKHLKAVRKKLLVYEEMIETAGRKRA
jgi:DNA-binding transcriptional MerR regulator